MDNGRNVATFELAGVGDDPLGLWTSAPADGPVHFGIGDELTAPPPDIPVYRIQLPADASAAAEAFSRQEAILALSANTLDAVPEKIDGLVARQQARAQETASDQVHFAVGDTGFGEDTHEEELLSLVAELDGAPAKAPATEDVHFGIVEDTINPVIEKARAQFDALLEQVNREALHLAWVETVVNGQTLAKTTVDWSGDAETVWAGGISAEQIALHNRTLRFATQSRTLKIQMAITVAGGASKIAALMTTPGGAVMALPVVYNYVNQILAQMRQYQALNQT